MLPTSLLPILSGVRNSAKRFWLASLLHVSNEIRHICEANTWTMGLLPLTKQSTTAKSKPDRNIFVVADQRRITRDGKWSIPLSRNSMQQIITAKLKLMTTTQQSQTLRQTQLAYRDALNAVSRYAFEQGKT